MDTVVEQAARALALRRIDAASGAVLECLTMPDGALISGLESDGQDSFFCGGARSGRVRRVRRSG